VRNAYIKFCTGEDRALGCEALIAHSHVSRLSNDVYCVPWSSLALLDTREVEYTFANEDDLTNARPIWKVAAAGAW
jgi:hypothetical protein